MNNNIDLFNISSEFYNDRFFSFNYENNDLQLMIELNIFILLFQYVKPIVF